LRAQGILHRLRRIGRKRRDIGSLRADIRSRTRAQRLHKLGMKRRRRRTQCLKALPVRGEHTAAMATDTSSLPAANTPVVGAAAAELAALSDEPMLDRSVAAEPRTPGPPPDKTWPSPTASSTPALVTSMRATTTSNTSNSQTFVSTCAISSV
jgi:hypothetical protein